MYFITEPWSRFCDICFIFIWREGLIIISCSVNVTLRDLGFMLIYFMDLFLMDEMVLILKSYFQVNKLKFLLLRKDLIRKRYTSAVFNIFPKSLVLLIIISYKKTQKTYWQMSSKTEFPQWSREHRYHLDISNCCHSRLFLLFQKMFFWGGPFLKSFLNLLQYCFCFMCWVFGH